MWTLGLVCIVMASEATATTDDRWYVSREEWGARPPSEPPTAMVQHAPLVVINHSEGRPCYSIEACSQIMRNIQTYYIDTKRYADFPYNFAIGTDGRVYEGRGWGRVGAHTLSYNTCALGLGYLGNYTTGGTQVNEEQILNMKRTLGLGVELGHLGKNYAIVAHRDVRGSDSPGENLYELMKSWPRYNTERYGDKKCTEIMQAVNNL